MCKCNFVIPENTGKIKYGYNMETTADTTNERQGLEDLRFLIKEFINSADASPKVREYLLSIIDDETMLLIYLKGCKYRVNIAWKALKRRAQVRLDEYPEVFPDTIPEIYRSLEQKGVFGVLKGRDDFERRIASFNAGAWDPRELPMEQLCAVGTHYSDKGLLDEDVMNNGLIVVANCDGMGLKHAKECSLRAMFRILNVFWLAYPIQTKGMYFLNVPTFIRYIYKAMQPFFSKKLKERLIISTTTGDKQFEILHKTLSPTILPKFLGGVLENEEAFDLDFLPPK